MGFAAFAGHKYLNLETFKKSGEGVKTPVWFAADRRQCGSRTCRCEQTRVGAVPAPRELFFRTPLGKISVSGVKNESKEGAWLTGLVLGGEEGYALCSSGNP